METTPNLAEENAALRRYVAYLETEVGIVRSEIAPSTIASAFGLSHTQALIAITLAHAYPRPASLRALRAHLGPCGSKRDSKSLTVQIHKMRGALGEDFAISNYAVGYTMSETTAARILVTLRLAQKSMELGA